MIIALGSVKGSPGVTCTAAATAAWLQRRLLRSVLLVEADPAGGVIAARCGLSAQSGMASLAARTRGASLSVADVRGHLQVLPVGPPVLIAPIASDQATSALAAVGEQLAQFLRRLPPDEIVLIDVGRFPTAGSAEEPTAPLLRVADGVALVASADREGLAGAAAWLQSVTLPMVGAALIARQPPLRAGYSSREIATELHVPVVTRLPDDPRAAHSAFSRSLGGGRGRHGSWWRGVCEVATRLHRAAPEGLAPEPVNGRVGSAVRSS